MTIKNFIYFRFLIKVILECVGVGWITMKGGVGHQDGNRNLIIMTV